MDEEKLIELVEKQYYEEALGVSLEASQKEVNAAYLRLISRFKGNPKVIEALHRAINVLTNEDDAKKGRRLFDTGRKQEALPYLEKAKIEPTSTVAIAECLNEGVRLYQAGKKEAALPYFIKVVKGRGNGDDYSWLGVTLAELGRRSEALPYLQKAVELRGNAGDYSWVGAVFYYLGRRKESLPYFQKAIQLRGNGYDYCWAGIVLVEIQRCPEALFYLEQAVKLRGDKTDYDWLNLCKQRISASIPLKKTSFLKNIFSRFSKKDYF